MNNFLYIFEKVTYLILRARLLISTILMTVFILNIALYLYGDIRTHFRLVSHPIFLLLSFILALDLLVISPTKYNINAIKARNTTKVIVPFLFIYFALATGEIYLLGHTLLTTRRREADTTQSPELPTRRTTSPWSSSYIRPSAWQATTRLLWQA